MRALILGVVGAMALSSAALAGPVTLKANPVDSDGRVTLGDLFDGAGAASDVVVGARVGPSAVFEAGQLQSLARLSGLEWANPTGLRRVVVRNAAQAPASAAAPAMTNAAAPISAPLSRPAPRSAPRSAMGERVISRNDLVEVAYETGGIRLTVTGRAQRNAAAGEPVAVLNLQSGRTIDAVATGPGRAIAGPAAQALRAAPQQFAAR